MERDQATRMMQTLLKKMVAKEGSDLFITAGFPPAIKIDGEIHKAAEQSLTPAQSAVVVRAIMNDKQAKQFDATQECNFAIFPQGIGRFRVSAFVQQGQVGAVIRRIVTEIPTIEDLDLPPALNDIVMTKRGLVILVGATGSGKSTTLAAMIGYRNANSRGHIVTIEDPIEFLHQHKKSTINQREVGADTKDFASALRAALRQAPKVILVGEMRDLETAEIALEAAETGHLVLSTLHTIDASKTIDRIIGLYPKNEEKIIRTRLAQTFRFIVSQRLIPTADGRGRIAAVEILKSNPRTREYIEKGETEGKTLLDAIRDGEIDGMQDFDSVIRDLIEKKLVTMEDGLSFATNQNNLLLQLKGLASTEDYVNAGRQTTHKPMIPPPPPAENPDSVLNMIE